MIEFLTIGLLLGLSVDIAPGTLLTLVISESLQHGVKAVVAMAVKNRKSNKRLTKLAVRIAR